MPEVSKTTYSRFRCALSVLACAAILSCSRIGAPEDKKWIDIPPGVYSIGSVESPNNPVRSAEIDGFAMQRTEVTVGQFVRFLNQSQPETPYASPQISMNEGRYIALVSAREPVAFVTHADATSYAQWMSDRNQTLYRLPTPAEWQIAATSGKRGLRFPWGWAPASGRAHFDAEGPTLAGQYAPNPAGLFDMAGNVAEWCFAEQDSSHHAPALGGSWAERDPDLLRVHHLLLFPQTYRDADVGFRLVRPIANY